MNILYTLWNWCASLWYSYSYDMNETIDFQEFPQFLSDEECNTLIQYYHDHPKKHLKSTVDKGLFQDIGKLSLTERDSVQMWIPSDRLKLVKTIQRRIQPFIGIDDYLQESLQLVHYEPGGFFTEHYDEKSNLFQSRYYRYGTLLIYLNDEFEGGETTFPRLNKVVKPEKGKAIYFKNINPITKKILWNSYHKGTTVLKGSKYIANLWIRIRNPFSNEMKEKMTSL
jgi:hypothetical protein